MSDTNTQGTASNAETSTHPQQPETQQGQNSGNENLHTQDEVNSLVGKVRKEATERAQKAFLEELGIQDVDTLKSLLSAEKKRKEAEMSEAERLQAQVEAANKKALEAQQALEALKQQQLNDKRANAVKSALSIAGGQDVDELYILLSAKDSDNLNALFDDNSSDADKAKLDAFIKQAQANYNRYFATSGAGSLSNSGGYPPTSRKQAEQSAQKQIQQKFGSL